MAQFFCVKQIRFLIFRKRVKRQRKSNKFISRLIKNIILNIEVTRAGHTYYFREYNLMIYNIDQLGIQVSKTRDWIDLFISYIEKSI